MIKLKGDYRVLAAFLAVWAVVRGWHYFSEGLGELIFWFCFLNLVLLAVGLYFRSVRMVSVVGVGSLITGIVASVDVLVFTFLGKMVFGVAGYLMESSVIAHVLTFYHLFLVVVPLYVLMKEKKFGECSWVWSSVFFLAVSLGSLIFTKGNANCVREFCDIGVFSLFYFLKPEFLPLCVFYWVGFTVIIFIPSYWIFRGLVFRN